MVFLILLFFLFFYFNLNQYLNFTALKKYQNLAQIWTTSHYKTAILFYIILFTILVACAIPCATFFTLLGGFLFGSFGIVYAVFSVTLGGVFLYLAVRNAFGTRIATKTSGKIQKMEAKFKKNAFNYLLMLRLIPIFPCWISNISAGVLNVPLKTFIGATILGILPATIIYVLAGRGLGKALALEHAPTLSILFTPPVFFPLLGLALLSLLPIIYKNIKK